MLHSNLNTVYLKQQALSACCYFLPHPFINLIKTYLLTLTQNPLIFTHYRCKNLLMSFNVTSLYTMLLVSTIVLMHLCLACTSVTFSMSAIWCLPFISLESPSILFNPPYLIFFCIVYSHLQLVIILLQSSLFYFCSSFLIYWTKKHLGTILWVITRFVIIGITF